MNKAILIGHVGRDPEARSTKDGKQRVVKFSLATNRGRDETDWHNIVCFGKTAEIAEAHVKKGDRIAVEGRIRNDTYEKDGQTLHWSEIIVGWIEFLGGDKATPSDTASDLPF